MRRRREISPLLSPFLASALTCDTYFVTTRWSPEWPAFLPRLSDAGFDPVVIGSLARTREFDLGETLASHDWLVKDYQPYLKK